MCFYSIESVIRHLQKHFSCHLEEQTKSSTTSSSVFFATLQYIKSFKIVSLVFDSTFSHVGVKYQLLQFDYIQY